MKRLAMSRLSMNENPSVSYREGVFLIAGKPVFVYSGKMYFFRATAGAVDRPSAQDAAMLL